MATAVHNRYSRTDSHQKNKNTKEDEIIYQIVLESTDSESEHYSSESVCSIQAETTVSAKDSSDISTLDESESFSEFELASSPVAVERHPWSFDQNISSGSSPHKVNTMNIESVEKESDDSLTSSEYSENDPDLSIRMPKFLYCAMCSSINRNPFFRLCNACYKIKKGFFPAKPAAKKRKRTNEENDFHLRKRKKYVEVKTKSSTENSPVRVSNLNNQSDPCGSNTNNDLSNENAVSHSTDVVSTTSDSGFESSQTNSQNWSPSHSDNDDEKCLACLTNSKNALFLHGTTGHVCCCYHCAKKIWFESKRCPICRGRVRNIIRIVK